MGSVQIKVELWEAVEREKQFSKICIYVLTGTKINKILLIIGWMSEWEIEREKWWKIRMTQE